MRTIAVLIVCLLTAALPEPPLRSAPIDGAFAKAMEVPGEGWTTIKRFRGGERACVLVSPLSETKATVEIAVYDAKGKKIAEDRARPDAPQFAAVFWYPPRDGDYKITITPSQHDAFYVVVR